MLEKVRKYAEKWHMLESEDCVITGVSGGADSVCLVLMLLELQKEIGFRIVAVHVNHGLRGKDADADEAFVLRFCEEHGIPCESYFADVELIAKNRKQSTEETGREVRKAFFEEVMQKYSGTKIALAHHQNDNAETFFLNLTRGTGLKGLGGIAPVNGNVIRPLLGVTREEIEAYLEKHQVAYCTDQSNLDDAYTRNRIRNHVLPYLKDKVNGKTIAHMNETMAQLRMVQEYLEEQVQHARANCVKKENAGCLVCEDTFQGLPEVLKPMVLRDALVQVCKREKDLENVHLESLQGLWEKQTGKRLDLPYGMEARRVYQGISICIKEGEPKAYGEYTFAKGQSEATFQWGTKTVRCRVYDRDSINMNPLEKKHTKWFDYDIIKDNICFRSRKQGDYICIHPDGKTQKLKSYFINQKIPLKEREQILLVTVGSHVLWITGYRQSCECQVTADTKHVLEIQVDEGENYGSKN